MLKWYDIRDPHDSELDRLAQQYKIHPLHVEDCRKRNQRAKVEENTGYLFTVMKPVRVHQPCELEVHDLDIILGEDWVITVQEGNHDCVTKILAPIHALEETLRPDQVLYRVADGIVDSYVPILDKIDDEIDEVEEKVLGDPSPEVLSRIFAAKRTLIELRRILANTRDASAHLYRVESPLIQKDLMPFFRDIYDHVVRNLDLMETQRDLLTGAMDVYLSSVANRTNEVMKVLTILGTIALPVLVISGFYGMNTKGLPFEDSAYGTPIVIGMMVLTTALLLFYLRRSKWF